ncbi:hypothetical protein BDF19DRAFT_438370 [Syncephalis fuscata]|nr:hypothetical protein BDF19DRAFT_438370 [Syncephalis fuscata]
MASLPQSSTDRTTASTTTEPETTTTTTTKAPVTDSLIDGLVKDTQGLNLSTTEHITNSHLINGHLTSNSLADSDLEDYVHMLGDVVSYLYENGEHEGLRADVTSPTEPNFSNIGRRRFPLPNNMTNRHNTTNDSNSSNRRPDICIFYQRGNCRHGSECRFRHIDTTSDRLDTNRRLNDTNNTCHQLPIPCRYWTNNENCPWGNQCRYQHPSVLSTNSDEEATSTHFNDENEDADDLFSESGTLMSDNDDDETVTITPSTTATAADTPTQLSQLDTNGQSIDTHSLSNTLQVQQQQQQRRRANTSDAGTSRIACRYWVGSGRCRWVDRCRFRHDPETRGPNHRYHDQDDIINGHIGHDTDMHLPSWDMYRANEEAMMASLLENTLDPSLSDGEEAGMCGFTADQVMELLSQGVKPWDEEAWLVMEALGAYDDDYNEYNDSGDELDYSSWR